MKKRRNWLKTTIAMLTLIATVLETGFSTVSTMAAEITTEDGIVVNTDAVDEADLVAGGDEDLRIDVSADDGYVEDAGEVGEDESYVGSGEDAYEEETNEEAGELREGTLDVTDRGISGTGYDEISVYVDTEELGYKRSFYIEFVGPDGASYNTIINEKLFKTNDGRYDFENLEGGDFLIRATSDDKVVLSYRYNEDGYPEIVVSNEPVEKVLEKRTVTLEDGSRISAISGEGYESVKVEFDTEELSDKASFKLFVESDADATVDGKSAVKGIDGLDKDTESLVIEDLDDESFIAYLVTDDEELQIQTSVETKDVEDGIAAFTVDNLDVKRIYEYEDSKIKVTATLEKADAVPDDAYFGVEPLSEEEAEAYLAALNKNLEEGQEEYTADNTLLYDIGFYTDETKSEEIEPEEGSVRLSVEFKKNQIEEELGAESKEDIEVTHFIEEGSKIEPEKLELEENGDENTIEVVTDSFSKFSFRAINPQGYGEVEVTDPKNYSTEDIMGGSFLYGITADKWDFGGGDAETNFAVHTLKISNGAQTGVNNSKAAGSVYQYSMVGKVEGQTKIKGYNCDLTIPESEKWKIQPTGSTVIKYITAGVTEQTVQNTVNGMIGAVQTKSQELAKFDSIKDYSKVPNNDQGNHLYLDISGADVGTYFINLDNYYGLKKALSNNGQLHIKKKKGQKIVFNTSDKNVTINKFSVVSDDLKGVEGYSESEGLSSSQMANLSTWYNPVVEDFIFNMPNATNVSITDAAGLFLAPKAYVEVSSVAGGWITAQTVKTNCEWHFVNGRIPSPEPKKIKKRIPVTKEFPGGAGLWEGGFKFKLERLNGSGTALETDANKKKNNQEITIDGGNSETAVGYFDLEWDMDKITDWEWNGGGVGQAYKDIGYDWVHIEWYQVTEVPTGRNDINENVVEPESDWQGPNSKKWFIHLYIYKRSSDNGATPVAIIRTARKDPNSYDWSKGLPCVEEGKIVFKNTPKPKKFNVDLEGIKKINGSSTTIDSNKFAFTLYSKAKNGNSLGSEMQTKWNQGNSIKFDRFELKLGEGTENEYENNDHNKPKKSIYYFIIKETECKSPYIKDESTFVAKVIAEKNNNKINSRVEYYRFPKGENFDITKCVNASSSNKYYFDTTKFEFNNTYEATGKAVINGIKMLEGRDMKKNDVFTFTLTSTNDDQANANQTKTFTVGEVLGDDLGKSFKFSFDELTYDLDDVGKEYVYTVKETKGSDRRISYSEASYNVTVTVTDNGDGTLDAKPDKGTTTPLEFINTYYDAEGDVEFKAYKEYVTGSKLSDENTFSFKLEGGKYVNGAITSDKVSQLKSRSGEGEVKFDIIKYADLDSVGEYRYTIKEVVPNEAVALPDDSSKKIYKGIIYDDRTYYAIVVVSDNKTGTLQKKIYGSYNDYPEIKEANEISEVYPHFINDYKYGTVSDSTGGTKTLHGKDLERGQYTFKIEPYNDEAKTDAVVMPSVTEVKNGIPESIPDKNQFVFGDITFKSEGTYDFLITETVTDEEREENTVYSTDKFVQRFVVGDDNEGNLTVTSKPLFKLINGQLVKADEIVFVNTNYKPGEVPLYAYKQLDGKKLEPGMFTFYLRDADDADKKIIQTKSNDASGIATFDNLKYEYKNITFDAAGKAYFHYIIEEKIPAGAQPQGDGTYKLNGYTYDGHKENVTVTVTAEKANGEDTGVITVVADNAVRAENSVDGEEHKALFENTYEAKGEVPIEGVKKITGRKFEDSDSGKFYALLVDKEKDTVLQKVPITKSTKIFGENGGEFKFEPLKFTQDDFENVDGLSFDKKYIVKESEETVPGIENDVFEYEVTVTVTDNEDGTLTVVKDPEKPEDLAFDNEYKGNGTVTFKAKKRVNGAFNSNKKFTFELLDKDPASGEFKKAIDTAVNGDGGLIKFNEITYTEKDLDQGASQTIKEYRIREQVKTIAGYTLSTQIYAAKAFLTVDKASGKISVDKKYYKYDDEKKEWVAVDEADVIFDNTYDAEGPVKIKVKKTLNGRDITEDNKFFFDLYDEKDKVNPVASACIMSAKAGQQAVAEFPEIKYTYKDLEDTVMTHKIGDGEYAKYYTLKERIPSGLQPDTDGNYHDGGYTYDGSVYNVVVTLKDNGSGEIKTDWYAYKPGEIPVKSSFWDDFIEFVFGKGERKNVAFVNDYTAEGHLELSARKILEGKKFTDDDDFVFILKQGDKVLEEKSTKKDGTVGTDGTVTVNFTTIDYNINDAGMGFYKDPQQFNYTIVEKYAGETIKGVSYSDKEYAIAVTVQDTKAGKLKVDASIDGAPAVTSVDVTADGKTNTCQPGTVDFTNKYEPKPVSITIGGLKAFSGRDLKVGDEFSFTMKKNDDSAKEFKSVTVTKTAGETWDSGKFSFPAIEYTPADMAEDVDASGKILTYARYKTFKYEIYEEIPTETNGITYDTKHYFVTVVVENENGVLTANAYEGENVSVQLVNNKVNVEGGTLWGSSIEDLADKASFSNTYTADGEVLLAAKKIVTGRKTDDTFTFNLTDEAGTVLNSITVKGDGVPVYFVNTAADPAKPYTFKYTFDDKGKTFVYYIEEVDPKDGKPYRYSETKYKVEVTPTDKGDGSLDTTPAATVVKADNLPNYKDNEEYKDKVFEFINEYDAVGTFNLTGKKILNIVEDGDEVDIRKIDPNFELPTFTFQLIGKDDSGNFFDANGEPLNVIATTESDKNGDFEFKLPDDFYKLEDKGHEFDYKVVEVTPDGYNPKEQNRIGFTYDMTEYDVHVTVNDKDDQNKDGKLDVKWTVTSSESEEGKANNAARKSLLDKIRDLFKQEKGPDCVYVNLYDSVGIIDPPIVTKEIMGRKIQRGEFSFEVTGTYASDEAKIRSVAMKDPAKEKNYLEDKDCRSDEQKIKQTIENGYIPGTKDTSFEYTNPITKVKETISLSEGELYVGNVEIRYSDLKKTDANGYKYDDFVYQARELKSEDSNVTDDKAVLFLFVHAVDQKNGIIKTTGHGAGGELIWEKVNKETGEFEPVKAGDVAFVNKWHAKGSLDLKGFKAMIGRDIQPEDEGKFSFTVVDLNDATKTYTTTNKMNPQTGKPTVVEYKHYEETLDKDGNVTGNNGGVEFFNYRFDYGEKSADPADDKDERGTYRYKIYEEDPGEGQAYDKRYYIVTVDVDMPVDPATGYFKKNADLDVTITSIQRYLESGIVDPDWEFAKNKTDNQFLFENPFEATADLEFAGTKLIVDAMDPGKTVTKSREGYTFELYEYMGPGRGSELIASAKSKADGSYVIKPVKEGKTYLFDQDDLNGYEKNGRDYSFSIREKKNSVGQWVDGVFEYDGVLYDNANYSINVNLHYVYDANGKITGIEPTIVSIDKHTEEGVMALAPTESERLNFRYDFTNKVRPDYKISGRKIWKDDVTDDSKHPKVTIYLMRNGVKLAETVAEYPDWKYEFVTDKDGKPYPACDAKGKPYEYKVEEGPVEGYEGSVKLNADGTIDFINTRGPIMIKKIDADTGAELEGARLAIYDGSTKLEEWVSEIGPHVVTSMLTAGKTYTLRELEAPKGYDLASDVSFVAPTEGKEVTVKMADKPIVGSVTLYKRDAATRELLAGAEFALYTEADARVYGSGSTGSYTYSKTSSNGVFVVDSTGKLNISGLPYGTYYFEETKAPEGYTITGEHIGFTILKNGENVEVTCLDPKALGSVRLRKVGSTGTGRLEGALFELYAATPTSVGQAAASTIFGDAYYRVGQFRTNSAGEIYVGDLPWDKYYFVEVEAPDGYELAKDVNGDDLVYTFTISASTTSATIDLGGIVNTPTVEEEPPQVLGERIKRGGVVNGVLGVRAKPNSGVLGERIGPVTGDASNIVLWLLLLGACVATIVATIVTGKKKKAAK